MVKFKIGRILLPALALAATVSSSFAQVSIGGVTAQNAQVSREKVETKYGTFYVKGGFPVERYESGAVKSFYIENFGQLTRIYDAIFGELYIETPVPGIDYLSKKNAQPIEFYEDGTLKAVRLADVRYESLGGDGYKHITFKKYKESLAVFPKSTIQFHENGNIKSMKVAHDQSFKFLRELKTSSNKKPVFKNQSEIVFYESGAIKEFIPENARLTNPFGFGMRPGYSVVVGEDDPKKVLSFYPAAGSALTLGDGIKVTCVPKEPVVFYGDGKTLKQISWSFEGTNFTLGKVNFYSSSEGGATSQTVFFSETGGVKSVQGIFAVSPINGEKTLSSYPAMVDGKPASVRQIDYDENGEIAMVDFAMPQPVSEDEVKGGTQILSARKIYYKDGARVAAIGNAALRSSMGSFHNTDYDCVLIFDGEKINTVRVDGRLSADSAIVFDESGKATTVSLDGGKILEIK